LSQVRIVALASGSGSNVQAIIDRAGTALPIEVAAIICNKPSAAVLDRARLAGIPAHLITHRDAENRAAFDAQMTAAIDAYKPDLVVLAGFMRILTSAFVHHYAGRLINIHPSLLPKYPGLHTHARVLDNGDSEHGASVHFVTDGVDEGPLILQGRVPVLSGDDEDTLAARVLTMEHRLLPQCILWFAQRRLHLVNDAALLDGKPSLANATLSDF